MFQCFIVAAPGCVADADIIFSSCGVFFFLLVFFLAGDWMSTILPHMVQIYNAGLKRAVRRSLKIQDAKKIAKTSPSGYIFAIKACIDNREKTC